MAARQEEIFGSSPHWASFMAEDEGWRSVAEPNLGKYTCDKFTYDKIPYTRYCFTHLHF
jgi:hypothetical protein